MVYLLFGTNSYATLHKVSEIRESFLNKNKDAYLAHEIDGENYKKEDLYNIFGQRNLFSPKRLLILKNIFKNHPDFLNFLKKNTDILKSPQDFFIFWERDLSGEKEIVSFFKKHAEKIQETRLLSDGELDVWLQKKAKSLGIGLTKNQREAMIFSAGEQAEWALENELEKMALLTSSARSEISLAPRAKGNDLNWRAARPHLEISSRAGEVSLFASADKIFYNNFSCAILEFNKAVAEGVEPAQLIYTIFWKLKNIILVHEGDIRSLNPYVARKAENESKFFSSKKAFDSFWQIILAESQLKKDSKNANEIMERLFYQLRKA